MRELLIQAAIRGDMRRGFSEADAKKFGTLATEWKWFSEFLKELGFVGLTREELARRGIDDSIGGES